MTQQGQGRVIPVANTLRLKVGGGGGIDLVALARAEQAIKGLTLNCDQLMREELSKLDEARARMRIAGFTAEAADGLRERATDLRGLSTTYGYPVVTNIAASLGRLIGDPSSMVNPPLSLLDAHIASMKAAVRSNIRDIDNPVAKTLLAELETCVRDYQSRSNDVDQLRSKQARPRS